jgi:DNA repair exonuclease SbcCD ATPase subunit
VGKDQPDFEEKQTGGLRGNSGLVVAETLRSVSACKEESPAPAAKSEEKLSVFWRVFGGTLLSIGALVIMTAYTGLSGAIADLRKEVNQEVEKRTEYAHKDELNSRITTQWTAIKEVQTAAGAVGTVNDRVKVLDQQMERVGKNADEDRRELRQKLDDQRRAFDDERKELQRKLDEQRRSFEDERREVQTRLQALSERLAAVEARQGAKIGPPTGN